jgi:hypothetical protein
MPSESTQQLLTADLRELVGRFNRAEGGVMVVPAEYAEVVAVRA